MTSKKTKKNINGLLLLDKPIGLSSNQALQKVRKIFNAEKAGHTGVLDPLASGLLPICFGESTKFAQYLLDADKAYTAKLKFGEATTTGDIEGEIISKSQNINSLTDFEEACLALSGKIKQMPPMYSALKHEGKPLYEYARKGITIERKLRDIVIQSIKINKFDYPIAEIDVRCSKGTYIRTLSEDIAKKMNNFAHLIGLRRTETAGFILSNSYSIEMLQSFSEIERDECLLPSDTLVQHLSKISLDALTTKMIKNGQCPIFIIDEKTNAPIRAYTQDNQFIGLITKIENSDRIKALRLMNTAQ